VIYLQKLSEKQRKFADYYIQSGNAAESYKKAGYKVNEATARANSSRMLTNASIIEYIKSVNETLSNCRIADMEEVKNFWSEVLRGDVNGEKVQLRDRIKASELIAKSNGAFITKIEELDSREIIITMSDELKDWGG